MSRPAKIAIVMAAAMTLISCGGSEPETGLQVAGENVWITDIPNDLSVAFQDGEGPWRLLKTADGSDERLSAPVRDPHGRYGVAVRDKAGNEQIFYLTRAVVDRFRLAPRQSNITRLSVEVDLDRSKQLRLASGRTQGISSPGRPLVIPHALGSDLIAIAHGATQYEESNDDILASQIKIEREYSDSRYVFRTRGAASMIRSWIPVPGVGRVQFLTAGGTSIDLPIRTMATGTQVLIPPARIRNRGDRFIVHLQRTGRSTESEWVQVVSRLSDLRRPTHDPGRVAGEPIFLNLDASLTCVEYPDRKVWLTNSWLVGKSQAYANPELSYLPGFSSRPPAGLPKVSEFTGPDSPLAILYSQTTLGVAREAVTSAGQIQASF